MSGGVAFHAMSGEETLARLRTNRDGLLPAEAARRLRTYGSNEPLRRFQALHYGRLLVGELLDPVVVLLIVSSTIAILLGDMIIGCAFIAITLLNVCLGYAQQVRSAQKVTSLRHVFTNEAHVVRGGLLQSVLANTLVPGDIVFLTSGVAVPADMRLFSVDHLLLDGFALTGESKPVHAHSHTLDESSLLAQRHNMAYLGTSVLSGSGYGIVTATGERTITGAAEEQSNRLTRPNKYRGELQKIARVISLLTLIISLALLLAGTLYGLSISHTLLLVIALIAAIVPQGLPSQMTTSLVDAASRLHKRGVLVRNAWSLPSLAATSVLFSDKTGTLTTNHLVATSFCVQDMLYQVTGTGYSSDGFVMSPEQEPLKARDTQKFSLFFDALTLGTDARIGQPDTHGHAEPYAIGSPLEASLRILAMKAGIDPDQLAKQHRRLHSIPFDSVRKRAVSVHSYGTHGKRYVFIRGSVSSVLALTKDQWLGRNTKLLTSSDRRRILAMEAQQAEQGARSIAIAYAVLPASIQLDRASEEQLLRGAVWLGTVHVQDPLRDDAPSTVHALQHARITVHIASGDAALGANAIARISGITSRQQPGTYMSAQTLAQTSDTKLRALLMSDEPIILSRASSDDKLRLVLAAQSVGHIVTMTGDGINDAAALKAADNGAAMGKSGTDVAKDASSVILEQDSLRALYTAIMDSRRVLQNIKKATLASFTSNIAELTILLVSFILGIAFDIPLAIAVMHILAIDLLAELLPTTALSRDHAMSHKEEAYDRGITLFSRSNLLDITWTGLFIAALAVGNYLYYFERAGLVPSVLPDDSSAHLSAMTLAYVTVVLCQLMNIILRRTPRGLFSRRQLSNGLFWLALLGSVSIVALTVYLPSLQGIFQTHALGLGEIGWALLAAAVFTVIRQFYQYDQLHHRKAIYDLHSKNRALTGAK